jgi:hypothetical protein
MDSETSWSSRSGIFLGIAVGLVCFITPWLTFLFQPEAGAPWVVWIPISLWVTIGVLSLIGIAIGGQWRRVGFVLVVADCLAFVVFVASIWAILSNVDGGWD